MVKFETWPYSLHFSFSQSSNPLRPNSGGQRPILPLSFWLWPCPGFVAVPGLVVIPEPKEDGYSDVVIADKGSAICGVLGVRCQARRLRSVNFSGRNYADCRGQFFYKELFAGIWRSADEVYSSNEGRRSPIVLVQYQDFQTLIRMAEFDIRRTFIASGDIPQIRPLILGELLFCGAKGLNRIPKRDD